jgi:hypothetical protein
MPLSGHTPCPQIGILYTPKLYMRPGIRDLPLHRSRDTGEHRQEQMLHFAVFAISFSP